jgi:hypothetical protein
VASIVAHASPQFYFIKKKLVQMFNVLAMLNCPFEKRRQVEYLKLKLTSFSIGTHVLN